MTESTEKLNNPDPADQPEKASADSVPRGEDDRRRAVNPADSPAPRSPEPDEQAVRKGEENLDRVKPY